MDDRLIKRHEDDATSVTLMVAELQHEPFDPVLIFKPQGSLDDSHPMLDKNSFVLVIQTEFQMELYRKYASTILCRLYTWYKSISFQTDHNYCTR